MARRDSDVFDPAEMLLVLARHDVRFMVIGGIAATLHGAPFPTFDLDLCVEIAPSNLDALAAALIDLEAREWDPRKEIDVERAWDATTLSVDKTWILHTRLGRLDVLFEPAGTSGYSDLQRNRLLIQIEGTEVAIAAISDLIRMKEAAGRERDRQQLPTLRLLEERSELERPMR